MGFPKTSLNKSIGCSCVVVGDSVLYEGMYKTLISSL